MSAKDNMPEKTYTLEEIKTAYFAEFNEAGEVWFNNLGTSDENIESTENDFDDFVLELEKAKIASLVSCNYRLTKDLQIVGSEKAIPAGSICTLSRKEPDHDLGVGSFECGIVVWVKLSDLDKI